MKRWEVTITAAFDYNEEDHGEFIQSAEDAENDAREWLESTGANPGQFEIEVKEIDG